MLATPTVPPGSNRSGTIGPSSTLQGRSASDTLPGMVSRRNIDALTKAGNRRRELRAELEQVEDQINKGLTKCYGEGWTWDELLEASSLSLGTLRVRLSKLGLTESAGSRSQSTPVAQERKAQARKSRT